MGTRREVKGYVVVVKPYRKSGNGAIGSDRKGNSGKRCFLYKVDDEGNRELVSSAEGPNAKVATKKLRDATGFIPSYVAISHKGETSF
ncbi:MAG: hypothetical protein QG639_11 [Patescibacteria group bacterium]|nr:hypothetical protein [Patescibacteria group bacterium]